MQLRELLKNQQILAPLVSAKNTSQQSDWEAFSQLLANKNEKVSDKPIGSSGSYEIAAKRNDDNPKFVKKTSVEKKFNIKVDVSESTGYKPADVKTTDSSYKTDERTVDNKTEKTETTPKNTKTHKPDSDEASSESAKLKDALKAKLKKETGLSDDQVNQLLATMDLSTDALKQMLAGGEGSSELFTELSETIENLEIDEALDKNLSGNDLTHLKKQLDKLVETLDKVKSNVTMSESEDASVTLAKAVPFEMKIIQALSKIISDLNAAASNPTNDAPIRPEDIRNAIMQAIAPVQNSASNNENDNTETIAASAVSSVSSTSINSSMQPNASNSSMSGDESTSQNPSQAVLPSALQTQTQTQTQMVQSFSGQPTESVKQDVLQTEADVKTTEGISMHQVAMKQGNSVITATIQQTPQLKQEIFTQIMDAIKGQIKLTDHGTSLLVKLQPEQLGNVELKLNIHKGIVLAEIKVENEIVKAAIESNLDDLKQSLSNKGYSVDQINVNVDSGKKDRQEAFEFDQQERRNKQNKNNEEKRNLEPIESATKYIVEEYEGSTINYYG